MDIVEEGEVRVQRIHEEEQEEKPSEKEIDRGKPLHQIRVLDEELCWKKRKMRE